MLINSTTDFRKYFTITTSMEWVVLQPYVNMAETKWLLPLLGKAQYDDLQTAYTGNTWTEEQTALFKLVQPAIAYLGFYLYIPYGQLSIDTAGIRIISDATKKTAFQWQINKLEESCINLGFEALERMLIFLEANKVTYTLWADSDVYATTKELFVNTAVDFNTYYNISSSRRIFLKLLPTMRLVHKRYIAQSLGNNYYTELLEKNLTNSLADEDTIIMPDLKSAVVWYSIYEGLVATHLLLSDLGYTSPSIDNRSEINIKQTPATENMLSFILTKARQAAASSLDKVKSYLNANASGTVFPTYFADTTVYVPPTTTPVIGLANKSDNGFYAV